MGGIILETERLSLREITEDELGDLLEIWGDPEAMSFFFAQSHNREERPTVPISPYT